MGNRHTQQNHQESQEPQLSYYQLIKLGYETIVNAIIRPPRATYEIAHLGPTAFQFCTRRFIRRDFEIINSGGQSLQCSQWEPEEYPSDGRLPCVIYMHGNSSARIEALPILASCLSLGITVVAFDFAGSGMSEGEWVTLGYRERDDLQCLIEYVRHSARVSTIVMWGRSMGAATAIMHGERDPSIAAMILDSPFADFVQLAEEMVEKGKEQGVSVPRFVTRLVFRMIRASVQARAGFNINHISPIAHAPRCFMPALFVAGKEDDFINVKHSQRLMEVYGGEKNLLLVDGDHNSIRPRLMYESVSMFLQRALQLREEYVLPGAAPMVGLPPWLTLTNGQLTCEEEDDALQEYWNDYLTSDVVVPEHRRSGTGRLMRENGTINDASSHGESQLPQMEIGMTQERQADLQVAIQHALGNKAGNTNGLSERACQSIRSRNAKVDGYGRNESVLDISSDAAEWACHLCTLINSGQLHCEACGESRPARRHRKKFDEDMRQTGSMRGDTGIAALQEKQARGRPPPSQNGVPPDR